MPADAKKLYYRIELVSSLRVGNAGDDSVAILCLERMPPTGPGTLGAPMQKVLCTPRADGLESIHGDPVARCLRVDEVATILATISGKIRRVECAIF